MATVNFINTKTQTKGRMKKAIDYVTQESKTVHEDRILVSGFNCMAVTAYQDFISTKKLYGKEDGRQFYHFVQSFSPEEEITPELAHKVALRLAKFYKGFEVLVATHVDRDHIHSHFILNSVSFETGKKLHQNGNDIKKIRDYSDKICREFGLSVCEPKQKKTEPITGKEYHSAVRGDSWKMQLLNTIDLCMKKAKSKKQFKKLMADLGYGVKWEPNRKYITYFTPEGQRCRCNKLHHQRYSKEMMEREFEIREQILARRTETVKSTRKNPSTRTTDESSTRTAEPKSDFNFRPVDRDRTATDTDFDRQSGADSPRNLREPLGTGRETEIKFRQSISAIYENPRDELHHSNQETDGGIDQTDEGNPEDSGTGWEKEREEVFATSAKATRDRHQLSDSDIGVDSDFAHDLLQFWKNFESLGEEPNEEMSQDCTNTPHHIDKKRQRELREKGMTQGM